MLLLYSIILARYDFWAWSLHLLKSYTKIGFDNFKLDRFFQLSTQSPNI